MLILLLSYHLLLNDSFYSIFAFDSYNYYTGRSSDYSVA